MKVLKKELDAIWELYNDCMFISALAKGNVSGETLDIEEAIKWIDRRLKEFPVDLYVRLSEASELNTDVDVDA